MHPEINGGGRRGRGRRSGGSSIRTDVMIGNDNILVFGDHRRTVGGAVVLIPKRYRGYVSASCVYVGIVQDKLAIEPDLKGSIRSVPVLAGFKAVP